MPTRCIVRSSRTRSMFRNTISSRTLQIYPPLFLRAWRRLVSEFCTGCPTNFNNECRIIWRGSELIWDQRKPAIIARSNKLSGGSRKSRSKIKDPTPTTNKKSHSMKVSGKIIIQHGGKRPKTIIQQRRATETGSRVRPGERNDKDRVHRVTKTLNELRRAQHGHHRQRAERHHIRKIRGARGRLRGSAMMRVGGSSQIRACTTSSASGNPKSRINLTTASAMRV